MTPIWSEGSLGAKYMQTGFGAAEVTVVGYLRTETELASRVLGWFSAAGLSARVQGYLGHPGRKQ
jgi:hypothetical protein